MKNIFKKLKHNWYYFKGYRFLFNLSYFLKFIVTAITLSLPLVFSKIISHIMDKNMEKMIIMLAVIVSLKLLAISIDQIYAKLDLHIKRGVNFKARQILFNQMMTTPPNRLNEFNDGKLFSLILNDSPSISSYVYTVIDTLFNFFTVISIGIIIFLISWPLALILLITYPLTYIVNNYFGKRIKKQATEIFKETDSFTSFYKTVITNLNELKTINAGERIKRFFSTKIGVLKNKTIANEKTQIKNAFFVSLIEVLNYIMILVSAAFFVITDKLILGDFIAFNSYTSSFTSGLSSIVNLNAILQPNIAILERIEQFEENCNNSELEQFKKEYPEGLNGSFAFNKVSLALDNKEILHSLTFEIKPGMIYGIIGKNGSGKTTIFNLITQQYLTNDGNILLDGKNINDIRYSFLQENIAYVRQNPVLFNMSLLDNLLLFNGSDDISMEKIEEACNKVNFLEDIKNMPQRFETEINDNRKLSVGQTQKLQLARTLLMDRPIILIDEATVNLDQSSKQEVYNIIKDLASTKTIIIITNNEDEFKLCDELFSISQ